MVSPDLWRNSIKAVARDSGLVVRKYRSQKSKKCCQRLALLVRSDLVRCSEKLFRIHTAPRLYEQHRHGNTGSTHAGCASQLCGPANRSVRFPCGKGQTSREHGYPQTPQADQYRCPAVVCHGVPSRTERFFYVIPPTEIGKRILGNMFLNKLHSVKEIVKR